MCRPELTAHDCAVSLARREVLPLLHTNTASQPKHRLPIRRARGDPGHVSGPSDDQAQRWLAWSVRPAAGVAKAASRGCVRLVRSPEDPATCARLYWHKATAEPSRVEHPAATPAGDERCVRSGRWAALLARGQTGPADRHAVVPAMGRWLLSAKESAAPGPLARRAVRHRGPAVAKDPKGARRGAEPDVAGPAAPRSAGVSADSADPRCWDRRREGAQ